MSYPLPLTLPPPFLPAGWASAHASLLTLCYVGGFYLSPTIRHLPKDDKRVMKSRLKVATIVTALGWVGTGLALWKAEKKPPHWSLHLPRILLMLGVPLPLSVPTFLHSSLLPLKPGILEYLINHLLPALILPLGLTMTLFTGPLYVEWLWDTLPLPGFARPLTPSSRKQPKSSAVTKAKEWINTWWNLHGLRNFIVGPLTEEIIWRSSILAFHYYAGASRNWLIFGTPLYFGIAHVHHAWETYKTRGRDGQALRFALLQSTVQFSYTTLFGWYANFLFLRTGSIFPPLLSHVFCNVMGLPNPMSAMREFPQHKRRICAAYLLGIIGFVLGLLPITKPALYGGSAFWS